MPELVILITFYFDTSFFMERFENKIDFETFTILNGKHSIQSSELTICWHIRFSSIHSVVTY